MLSILVKNDRQNSQFNHANGPLEFGRGAQGTGPRCVIEDGFVSRDQLRVLELPGSRLQIKNLSGKFAVGLGDGTELPTNGSQELNLPVRVLVGETEIDIAHQTDAGSSTCPVAAAISPSAALSAEPAPRVPTVPASGLVPIAAASREAFAADGYLTLQPVSRHAVAQEVPSLAALGETPSPETLTRWMETVLALQRSDAGGPKEFFANAARAMVKMIGLDVGMVLLHAETGWRVVARAAQVDDDDGGSRVTGREFSQTVLRQVFAERQTFYQDLALMKGQESLKSVDAVVVSPILGLNEEVVGALYGLRRPRVRQSLGGSTTSCKIKPLEAQLVQLLAAAVGANLARTAATRTRTQFEQFFSAELVRELERDPGLLDGRAHEVTILMSDLRSFSSVSERLGPQDTCRLVRDVMERLSQRIVEHGGVIVSYLGDGILSMWNAPTAQKDHAGRACRAALAMLQELPGLNAVWQPIVGHPLEIGIGINTGPAQVGNTGSSRKFMYGPLGNTVNLASRVEGATKHLGVPVLVTGSTSAQLDDSFVTRRLCQVRVVGIREPVDLYELYGETASPEWLEYRDRYEASLDLFEAGHWLHTCQSLLPLLERGRASGTHDPAILKIMKRSWACLEAPPDPFDPVLELTSK